VPPPGALCSGVVSATASARTSPPGAVVWLTGLSGAGKSTISEAVIARLRARGRPCTILDGDKVRAGLCRDLGFAPEDRVENVRRIGEVALLMAEAGLVVLVAVIAPYQRDRDIVREAAPEGRFLEVFVDTPLSVCESRDPKGLYAKARAGLLRDFTGIDAPYEIPKAPDIVLRTTDATVPALADQLVAALAERGLV
jgi:adenylyl-sulfate kinase